MLGLPQPQLPVDPLKTASSVLRSVSDALSDVADVAKQAEKRVETLLSLPLPQDESQSSALEQAETGIATQSPAVGTKNPFVEILNNVKTDVLQPEEKLALNTVSKELYRDGLLSKVLDQAQDAIFKFTEAKNIIKTAIQEQIIQDMVKGLKQQKIDLQPLLALLPELQSLGQSQSLNPQFVATLLSLKALTNEAIVAKLPELRQAFASQILQSTTIPEAIVSPPLADLAISTVASTVAATPNSSIKIPNLLKNISPDTRGRIIPLFAESAVQAVKELLQQNSELPLTEPQQKAQNLVTSLIALNIATTDDPEVQLVIPQESFTTNLSQPALQQAQATIVQFIQNIELEHVTLFKTLEQAHIGTTLINPFKNAPQELLALLKNVLTSDAPLVTSLAGLWAANRKSIEAAILQLPYAELTRQRDAIKELILPPSNVTDRPLTNNEQKLNLINQLLLAVPTLANFLMISQLLRELEDGAQETPVKLALLRTLLYNSGKEIVRIASGKATALYIDVSFHHEKMHSLATKFEGELPKNAEKLTEKLYQSLTHALAESVLTLKNENLSLFYDFLKKHPRTLLFLVHTNSPLVANMRFPLMPDTLFTRAHLSVLEEIVNRLSDYAAFFSYQPQVIAQLILEAKRDPQSAIAKNSIKVAYKAVVETISLLPLDQAEPLKILLDHLYPKT